MKFTVFLIGRAGLKTYRRYLERAIEVLDLKEHIKVLDFINPIDLLHVYNAADLTVVTSYSEGSPLVVPESLACGTPVIATDVGGNKEYLELVGLRDLIIDLDKYDFSVELFLKISKVMSLIDHVRLRLSNNMEAIPSWDKVGMRYMEVLKKF